VLQSSCIQKLLEGVQLNKQKTLKKRNKLTSISSLLGQISLRNTALPSLPIPENITAEKDQNRPLELTPLFCNQLTVNVFCHMSPGINQNKI